MYNRTMAHVDTVVSMRLERYVRLYSNNYKNTGTYLYPATTLFEYVNTIEGASADPDRVCALGAEVVA